MIIEEGMYVRTKNGKIRKIISLSFDKTWKSVFVDTNTWLKKEYITKTSHNIIDLIEVGDYVNGKPVAEIDEDFRMLVLDDNDKGWRTILKKDDIKTILTKEQFEHYCYNVVR